MLWREYAYATAEHIKLLTESQVAAITRDKASDEKLSVAIDRAGGRRESTRTAIQEHEAAEHEDTASGALP